MSIWDQNAMDVRQRLLWIHGGKTLEKAFFFLYGHQVGPTFPLQPIAQKELKARRGSGKYCICV